jgi:hypothetical protein
MAQRLTEFLGRPGALFVRSDRLDEWKEFVKGHSFKKGLSGALGGGHRQIIVEK